MTLTRYLRKVVFKISQQDFAMICCTTQATVSRWERCEGEPGRQQLGMLKAEARRRKLEWDERWHLDHTLTKKMLERLERADKKRPIIEAAA